MESGKKEKGIGEITRVPSSDVEEIIPQSDWYEDPKSYHILLNIPGFNIETIELEVDGSGHIVVSGERLIHDDKYIYFDQKIKLPDNVDIHNISGRFEGESSEIFNVTVMKQVGGNKKQQIESHESEESENSENSEQEQSSNDENFSGEDGDSKSKGKTKKNGQVNGFHEQIIKKGGQEHRQLELVIKLLKRNMMAVLTAILAFLFGVLFSRMSKSNES